MSPPWMPLYIADYRADTAHLSAAEHGAYLLLIMHYWSTGGLPTDDRQLARIACMTQPQWKSSRETLAAFFAQDWRHKRIDAELSHAADVIAKRKAAVVHRWNKCNSSEHTHVSSKVHSHEDIRARASPSQPPTQSSLRSERTRASALASGWPPDFREQFWQAFPNKVGKADALGKLERIAKSGEITFPDLMAALDRYAHKTDDRPWCNPATWLHQKRWTDDPAPPVAKLLSPRDEQQKRSDDAFEQLRNFNRSRDENGGKSPRLLCENPGERPAGFHHGDDRTVDELSELDRAASR